MEDTIEKTEVERERLNETIGSAISKASSDTSSFPNSKYRVYEASGIKIMDPQHPEDPMKITYPSARAVGKDWIEGFQAWSLPGNGEPTSRFISSHGNISLDLPVNEGDLDTLTGYIHAAGEFKLLNTLDKASAQQTLKPAA